MSDEKDWEEMLRQLEKELGGPLPAEHRERLNRLRPKVIRIVRPKGGATYPFAGHQKDPLPEDPLLAFMQTLKDRQGTTMPDFEVLYRRQAELDNDPRP